MPRHALQRRAERRCRIIESPIAQMQSADGVPRVRAAFSSIEVTARLVAELARKTVERCRVIVAREVKQAKQPMQRHSAKTRFRTAAAIAGDSAFELERGRVEHLACNQHGRGQPMPQTKAG